MNLSSASRVKKGRFRQWLFYDHTDLRGMHQGPHAHGECGKYAWWRVMCLTGVDYFSTLAYQPAIAVLVAGAVAPLASLVLVLVTLLCALPMYRWVAKESPLGSGSIAMLERLLPWWGGKLLILVLLGFIVTDFVITITLSSSDAAAHAVHNPYAPNFFNQAQLPIAILLILALGFVFLLGFREAIRIAVILVGMFLLLTLVVIFVSLAHLGDNPEVLNDWWSRLLVAHGNPWMVAGVALLLFPKLALGLSGFETGVTVMPQIRNSKKRNGCNGCSSCAGAERANYSVRIRGGRKLLTTAAMIMSGFLVSSNFIAALLIPQAEFAPGQPANGRALAYLAQRYLGDGFATVYDLSTIAILWFAGASAMAGMLNIIPRYLPRYGMAPQWIRSVRPLVIVITATATAIVLIFQADVDAQGGAYATGVLVLITSASVAVVLSARRKRKKFALGWFIGVAIIFLHTTVMNVVERPTGLQVAGIFILGIVVISLLSRIGRSFNLRATALDFDATATNFLSEDAEEYGSIHIITHDPGRNRPASTSRQEYSHKLQHERLRNRLSGNEPIIFLEVVATDSSDFEEELVIEGFIRHGYRILQVKSGNIPSTIAAVLLEIRNMTGVVPDAYFNWTERNPISNTFRYLITGAGEVAAVTREVLREAEGDNRRRPSVHVS